ncbi:hypothetical protein ABEB36_004679 [Hypothenemus hampei]|uniref:Crossover junction endonuclease EME1 n=1 Tax=Hypothenemus hampei TaxID=57062 RepID=A0ABD1F444_HYPHA
MNCDAEILSSSDSEKTVKNEIDLLLEKYTSDGLTNEIPTGSKGQNHTNMYSLNDFLDDDDHPGKSTQSNDNTKVWQSNFSIGDFCENSNEMWNHLQSKYSTQKPEVVLSKEVYELTKLKTNIQETIVLDCDIENMDNNIQCRSSSNESKAKVRNNSMDNKLRKAREKEQKKLEKENEKQLKNALKIVTNSIKPDQCHQNIIVNIDKSIETKSYAQLITGLLTVKDYKYNFIQQTVLNAITWIRKVPTIENMALKEIYKTEKHGLLIMEISQFLEHIEENTLTGYIQSLLILPDFQHLSLAILELPQYYRYMRDNTGETTNGKKKNVKFKGLPRIRKSEIEQKLIEIQIFCKNIYVRPIDKIEDLPGFVLECSKAVAQIPYKSAKEELRQKENEFFEVNNRDCIKVDKNGNGLSRLWNQMLTMFPLASLETAETISAVYPTMSSLFEAYGACATLEEAETLLQDLPIRRAAGPLGGQRRLGPELSKKVCKFFTATENVFL